MIARLGDPGAACSVIGAAAVPLLTNDAAWSRYTPGSRFTVSPGCASVRPFEIEAKGLSELVPPLASLPVTV